MKAKKVFQPSVDCGSCFQSFCSHFLIPTLNSALPVPTKKPTMPSCSAFSCCKGETVSPEYAAEHSVNYNLHEDLDSHPVQSSLSSVLQLEAETSLCQHSHHPGKNCVLDNPRAVGKTAISNRQLHSVLINVQRLSQACSSFLCSPLCC